MKELKELHAELSELTQTKIAVQADAACEINVEINRVKAEINHVKYELRKNQLTDFKKIYETIEQVSRMCFELYIQKGIDLEFQIKHHVHWVVINITDEYSYANSVDGELIPNFIDIEALLERVTRIYDEAFYE